MSKLIEQKEGVECLLMGNEAIARGALEAGVSVACGYPGTPSSEIIESLCRVAKEGDLYVEWSANEKVAMEVAADRILCRDEIPLHHETKRRTRGVRFSPPPRRFRDQRGDDFSSSVRIREHYPVSTRGSPAILPPMIEIPLLEPANFQEAKDMTRWAFELSEEIKNIVMVRSVTRLSHGRRECHIR